MSSTYASHIRPGKREQGAQPLDKQNPLSKKTKLMKNVNRCQTQKKSCIAQLDDDAFYPPWLSKGH